LISPKTHAQESDYSISTYEEEGFLATNTHYLGEARLHFSMPADSLTGYGITKVLFKANSTLNWHKHGYTQVLIINNVGYCREGERTCSHERRPYCQMSAWNKALAFLFGTTM